MKIIELLKINDFEKGALAGPFYCNTITGHLQNHHSRIEKPHKHNFYAVFLFTSGTGIHEIDFHRYDVKPGSVFFLYPGQTHSWELSDDANGFLFFHTEEFYEMAYASNSIKEFLFFESNYSEKCIYLNTQQEHHIEALFQALYREAMADEWKKKQFLLSLLTQIYICLNRYIEHHSTVSFSSLRHYRHIFSQFEKLLDTHFIEIKSATLYADLLNISQKHLNRIVKSVTTQTTTDIITNRIVLEAKRQLIYTDNSLSQVAQYLGYEDYTYFSKMFKKSTGVSASEFRKRYRENEN